MPSLTLEQYESCVVKEPDSDREIQTTCVRLLAQEYGEQIVTELKAMCLALGWGPEYCGTAEIRMEPSLMVPVAAGCFPHELKLEGAP